MTLYLLPNLLGPIKEHSLFLPISVDQAVSRIDGLIAESEGEGRRFLKRFKTKKKPHEIPIALLTKRKQEIDYLLEPILKGETWGVVSDCGLPCLADPGALLVKRAQQLHLPIETFSGPSSITYALILSGLSGQSFFFHGYIAKEPKARSSELSQWEKIKGTTHLFIEAPYRNMHTLHTLLTTLHPQTQLCIASSLTLPDQWIQTLPIANWRTLDPQKIHPHIHKKPTLFLFHN
jgi:16S rRNA (cytidine1402-2'-O)-methyltransferase